MESHTREHYPHNGPPFCLECSAQAQEWVEWPCPDSLTETVREPTHPYDIGRHDAICGFPAQARDVEYRRGWEDGIDFVKSRGDWRARYVG